MTAPGDHTSTVRTALRADLDASARTLAAAFHEDPWFSWLYPDADARPEQSGEWFALVLERAFALGHTHVAGDGGDVAGVVTWVPPDVTFPTEADIGLAAALLGTQLGDRSTTALGIIGRAGAAFGDEPRFHCIYLGVHPDAQGQGRGEALLRRVLDTCDRDGLPASLTSTNDANLAFYRRLGFTELGEVPIADTGRSLRPMWRAAR